jgi:hypothetical protein
LALHANWDEGAPPAQVVYPALDAKVKNVNVAYSVEHQEEVCAKLCLNPPSTRQDVLNNAIFIQHLQEMLLEQLAQLISAAISQAGADRGDTIR